MFVQKTQLESDLSLLPAPFFDVRDFSQLNLPVVMGDKYDLDEVKAAGVLSSYFGSLAAWRGAQFPSEFRHFARAQRRGVYHQRQQNLNS